MERDETFDILMVEDNPGDVRLVCEALKTCRIRARLRTVENGEAALDYLHRRGPYADAPRPRLILLDLNLPKKSGREVVENIKKDQDLRRIPVVILTSSQNETDIRNTYNVHANCYVNKPAELEGFLAVIESVIEFWFGVATLPPERDGEE